MPGALAEDLSTWVRRHGVVLWLDLNEHDHGVEVTVYDLPGR